MPEIADFTALALLAAVLFMGERWLTRLLDALTAHMGKQAEVMDECLHILLTIQDSFLKSGRK